MATKPLRSRRPEVPSVAPSSNKDWDLGSTGVRHELLAAEVLDKAAVLFASRGFAATSLKDVADAVGLQRSSIYHYYPSKQALLGELIRSVTDPVAHIFQDVETTKLGPLDKIKEVVRRLVIWVGDPKTHFRLMDRSEAELPSAIAKTHKEAKRRVLNEMMRLIENAVLAGEARAADPMVSAFSIIGMTMWTAWWFHKPTENLSLAQVADQIADNAAALIQRAAPARKVATVPGLTREIRNNLELIDRLVKP
jgi:AcrR family transcriptional regulator